MKKFLFLNKHRTLSQLFQIAIALWFFRMVLPGMVYLFVPVFLGLVTYLSVVHRKSIFQKSYIFEFLKTFNPLIILGVFFLWALLNSSQLYEKALRDAFEYFVNFTFLIIFFALTYHARKKMGFMFVFNKITRIIWISAVLVALLGLLKHVLQVFAISIPFESQWGTTFNQDKNFFALYSMLGIIGLIPRLSKPLTIRNLVVNQLLVLVLILNIVFSYAYRSLLLLGIIGVFFIVVQLLGATKNKSDLIKTLARNLRMVTLLFYAIITMLIVGNSIPNKPMAPITDQYYHNVFSGSEEGIKNTDIFNFDKWEYAVALFEQQTLFEKLFGNGFDYLAQFGGKFKGNALINDYPHNPVLSGLLYSGWVGGVFILFFILVALYYGGKYFKKYPLYALMLFTSMLFVLFSGNSLFSVPIFLFLFSLSFLIRHQEISELNLKMNLQKPGAKFLKESFDYILASLALVALSPLLLFITLVVGFTMGWPVVYTQVRIGQNAKPFKLHKFRSMKKVKSETTVAAREQSRITGFGRFIRRYKLDELPELWNIIRGDMSFVGPRPDVPGYADALKGTDRIILQLKPGLTGAASLKYMHEEELLAQQPNPQEYNDTVVFPDKVRVNMKYMEKWSLWLDFKIIIYTVVGKSLHEDKFL